ncbi:hypothetical protein [Halorussus caseinilyticus]|uniref:Uncharacterized protein n=1 Tax=Halorussus caseinilyticus TaxID=3034025 RepID=A0ABD5WIJ7_9EURY
MRSLFLIIVPPPGTSVSMFCSSTRNSSALGSSVLSMNSLAVSRAIVM